MKFDSLLLIPDDEQWQLVALHNETVSEQIVSNFPTLDDRGQSQQIQNLQTTLTNWGYKRQPLIIALHDHWCLSSSLQGNRSKNTRSNTLFDFEANWPISLEEVVVDYLPNREATLGVSAPLSKLKPVMATIEKLNLTPEVICPKALLALQQKITSSHVPVNHQTVWANGKAYHWFTISDRKPTHWHWLPADGDALVLQAKAQSLVNPHEQHLQLLDLPDADAMKLKDLPEVQSTEVQKSVLTQQAYAGAHRVATRKTKPWINLLRPPLIANTKEEAMQRALSVLLLSIVILGTSVAGALYWRAGNYQQIANNNLLAQQDIFRDIFPNSRMPQINIASRMESELRNITNHASALPSVTTEQNDASALTLLHAVLLSLPSNQPLDIQEIRLENNRIDLRGQAKEHADVQSIANALRTNTQLKVNTPQMTQTTDGMIRYTVTANFIASQSQGGQP